MAPAFADWLAICITSWVAFSLVLYAAALGWCLVCADWREVVDWRWFSELTGRLLAWCRTAFLSWRGSGSDESDIDVAVHNLVQQRKRNFIRRACFALAPIFALGDLYLLGLFSGLLESEGVGHPSNRHFICSAAFRSLTALCVFRENQPSKGVMVAFHVVALGSLLLTLHANTSGPEMLFDRAALGIRMMLVLSLCDLRLTVFCNSVYSAFTWYRFNDFASKDESFAQLGVASLFHQEIGLIMGFVAWHLCSSWQLEADSRTTIHAKVSTKFIAGLRKLLKTSYDVVVELDDQMIIADDAKDLAGVLLHGPHRSLKGSLITDLMPHDAEKEVFSSHVMNPALDSEAQCCPIPHMFHMRDVCSNMLCMEMWHTRFEDLDSRLRHLIGIKELANDEHTWNSSGPTDVPLARIHRDPPGTARGRRSSSAVDVSDEEQPRQGQISGQPRQGEQVIGRPSSSAVDVSDEEQPREGQISGQPRQGEQVIGRRSSSAADVSDEEQPREGQISRQPRQGEQVIGRPSSSAADVSDEEQPRQGQASRQPRQGKHVMERPPTSAVDVSGEEQQGQDQNPRQTRQQPAPQAVGRPRELSTRMSDDEDSDGSSISSTPPERSYRFLLEGFRLTSAQAQRASMLHTVIAWNVALRPAGCCAYHNLIKEASKTVKWLANAHCQEIDSIHSQAELLQCPNCGILSNASYGHASRVCYLCRHQRNATVNLIEM